MVPRASEERQVQGCALQPQNIHGEHSRLWVGLEGSRLSLGEWRARDVKELQQAQGLVGLHGLRRASSFQALLATTVIH